jgi:hypothetical protein
MPQIREIQSIIETGFTADQIARDAQGQLRFEWASADRLVSEPRIAEAELEEPERWDGMS